MSLHYYCVGEDNEKEESINNYKDLFIEYINKPPTIEEALNQIFISGGVPDNKLNDYVKDIKTKINKFIEDRESQIKEKYPNLSHNDSLIISSYTCEAINDDYSPYKILNRNLASDNRKEGLKKVSKYLYILLMALRKLKRYYPDEEQKYLYRGISIQVNTKIDPHRPKSVPYLRNKQKCFWAFTSTSPLESKAFDFLGNNGYHNEKQIKKGTFFSLYGKVWGYDISLFNTYNETEILLEPERKFRVENVISDANDIIVVTCEILDSPIVLDDLKEKIYSKSFEWDNLIYLPRMTIQKQPSEQKMDGNIVFRIFVSIISLLDYISFRYSKYFRNKIYKPLLCEFYKYNEYKIYYTKDESELFQSFENGIKLFEDKYFEYIEKYNNNNFFPKYFTKERAIMLMERIKIREEKRINRIISMILEIIIKGKRPKYNLYEFINTKKSNKYMKFNPDQIMNQFKDITLNKKNNSLWGLKKNDLRDDSEFWEEEISVKYFL